MQDINDFLQKLSIVMREDLVIKKPDWFENLCKTVNEKFYPALQTSNFPRTPAVMKRLSKDIADIDMLLTADMLIGRDVIALSLGEIEKGFDILKDSFTTVIPNELRKTSSDVPILIFPSSELSVTAVNYANVMCRITLSDYSEIIQGCTEYSIGAKKIIKYFCIGVPMKTDKFCCILDNREGRITDLLDRFISQRIYVLGSDIKNNKEITEDTILVSKFDRDIYSEYLKNVVSGKAIIDKINIILTESEKDHRYGFFESVGVCAADIDSFYNCEFAKCDKVKHSITEDIVRLGNANTDVLKECRRIECERYERLKNEHNELFIIIHDLLSVVAEIENSLSVNKTGSINAPDSVCESIITQFFMYIDKGLFDEAQKLLLKIGKYGYSEHRMIEQYYLCAKSGFEREECERFRNMYPTLKPDDQIKAKIFIGVTDPVKCSIDDLKKCAEMLGKPKTGHEYYVFYFIFKDDIMLIKSLMQGYFHAGEVLYEKSAEGEDEQLILAADALIPQACVALSDRIMENKMPKELLHSSGKKESANKKMSVTSSKMFYYKIAAAHEDVTAIERIVDAIYQDRFASPATIRSDNAEAQHNAELLVILCRYLKEHSEHPRRYNEYLGVVLFCMKDYSESFRVLSGCISKAARYCRGRMYEAGNGTVRNYAKAEEEYKKAGDISDAEKRYKSVVEKQRMEEEDDDDYDPDESYSGSSYRTRKSSGGCFITTAACGALSKGDNCDELNMLRKFRDEHISDSTDGEKLILEYYRIAPEIIDCINKLPDPQKVYSELWSDYIKPSYDEINNKNWDKAKLIYINMVKKLAQRFNISVKSEIAQKYDIDTLSE